MQEDTDLGCAGCAATDALPLLGDVTCARVLPALTSPAAEACACGGGEEEVPCACPGAQTEVELERLDAGEAASDLPLDATEIVRIDGEIGEAEPGRDAGDLALDEGGESDAAEVQPMMEAEYGESALAPVLSKALIQTLTEDLLRIWGEPPKHCREVGSGGRVEEDFFGDGSDGDLTWEGAGTDHSLTRDTFFGNVRVVENGINTHGYRMFVKGKLTLAASTSVHANGVAGVSGAQGGGNQTAYAAKGAAGGSQGQPGAPGSTAGAGAAGGTGLTTWPAYAPTAALAGCGGGGGGYCGDATGANPPNPGASSIAANGGAGGDGVSDGSSVALDGGSGGGGAGVLLLYANEIDNAGTLAANGGAGADGFVSGNSKGGAGGGGGGGAAIVYYAKASGSGLGTVQANGGAAGAVGGTATAGSAGVARTYQVNV